MLIGLAGFRRAGKDTLGAALVWYYGFTRFAFADALREEVAALDGIAPPDDAAKDAPGANGRSYRDALIARGQARRNEDPDYWVKALERSLHAATTGRNVVLTDCRFPNEIAWARSHGGVMVWVERAGIVSNGHITERDWSETCDFIVENTMGPPTEMAGTVMGWARTHAPRAPQRRAA